MSGETLGKDLLGDVKVEGLDELLSSIRELGSNSGSHLGILPIDRLLDVFQNPPPTEQQQHYRTQWFVQQEEPAPPQREKPLPVIEITDAAACSGNLQFLYLIISRSLLPAEHQDIPINGKGNAVVLLDLSGRFSILRLYDVMHNHVASVCSTSSTALSEQELTSLVSGSFTHLHIFRPQSSSSLLTTLASLQFFLLSKPSTHFSANRPLGLLAINDLSAFLWQDRLEADEGTGLPVSNHVEKANNTLFLQHYRSLVSSLRRIQHLFSCTIVATNWGLAPITSVAGHQALRPHLPSVWNNFCTVKIVVERDRVSKFGPGLSAEEAKKEGVQRWEAVEKSGFSGWINWWGSEEWREGVKEGVRELKNEGGFSFRVTADGIIVEKEGDSD